MSVVNALVGNLVSFKFNEDRPYTVSFVYDEQRYHIYAIKPNTESFSPKYAFIVGSVPFEPETVKKDLIGNIVTSLQSLHYIASWHRASDQLSWPTCDFFKLLQEHMPHIKPEFVVGCISYIYDANYDADLTDRSMSIDELKKSVEDHAYKLRMGTPSKDSDLRR